jgi:hypothetical protein
MELVSLALVSEDGEQVFYAERSPLPAEPTQFVQQVVYPLLEGGTAALPDLDSPTRCAFSWRGTERLT